jgi:deferrochelatase/peroxidase EfeB
LSVSRRSFIKGTASGAAGTALAGGVLIGGARADARPPGDPDQATEAAYPFHGPQQAGVLTPGPAHKQAFACVAAFDCTAASKAELGILMYQLTERAWFLTTGGTPPGLGVGQPPADSDVLGPTVPADGLTITVSVGSSLFDDRYGLGARKPLRLTPMPVFPNDSPEPA